MHGMQEHCATNGPRTIRGASERGCTGDYRMPKHKHQARARIPYEYQRRLARELGLEDGEQVHINHEDCPAGNDTKRRLYVKREKESVLFYCHHCNQSGRYNLAGRAGNLAGVTDKDATGQRADNVSQPIKDWACATGTCGITDAVRELDRWPVNARQWVTRYITEREAYDYGLFYSALVGGVCIPIGSAVPWDGLVVRLLLPSAHPVRPAARKYLTYRRTVRGNLYWRSKHVSDTLVIVEDCLSAIKVARHADSLAILGAHYGYDLMQIVKEYQRVIVYMDNDNQQIRNKQEILRNQIALVNHSVRVHRSTKDPKECSDEELLRIVNGH